MVATSTTVGGYLQSLPNDKRVAMARVCSMIRRSARGVRESMRYGLAFYELDGPLFAVESVDKKLILFVAEKTALESFQKDFSGVNLDRCCVEFTDLLRLPLDLVEKLVRASLAIRRTQTANEIITKENLLKLWKIEEEAVAVAPPIVRIVIPQDDPAKED